MTAASTPAAAAGVAAALPEVAGALDEAESDDAGTAGVVVVDEHPATSPVAASTTTPIRTIAMVVPFPTPNTHQRHGHQ
ncbi:hypothetical protein MSZK_28530 [Mycobacterium sp. shizuoka-1]|nr:hypothetical protein MSZK_28530 [Mycobacterium sp. shizuoka-1]